MPAPAPTNLNRRRVVIGIAVVAVFVLITSLRGIAGFYTDYLWFDSLGFASVWRDVLWAKFALGTIFTVVFFALMWINLWVADRIGPTFRPRGPEEEMVERYHALIGGRTGLMRIGVSALFALIAGAGVSAQWEDWLLFVNGGDFGIKDPQFGRDVGFYVFKLPFLSYLVGWAFAAVLIVFIVTAVAHYLNGGIRVQQPPGQKVSPAVKGHLSLLLGLLALIKAAGYYLDQFELNLSTRGFVDGASYTDINAQLPAIRLLMIISVFSFFLLVYNIWRRGFTWPVIAVSLWALVAVIAGTIYPAFVQRFRVIPSESTREAPYIARNIEATRAAVSLDAVVPNSFDYQPELTPSEVLDNVDTIRNVRLLDPAIIKDTFEQVQGIRGFYDFRDVDVDRYEVAGRLTQVVLSARELNLNGLSTKSWESEHVAFTHGYGLAVAPANGVDPNGRPEFIVGDIPTRQAPDAPELAVERPGIYFGENLRGYSIVGAKREEVDFQSQDDTTVTTRYQGAGGVQIGSLLRRLAYSLRFADPNLVISSQLQGSSRIIYIRDIRSRVNELAPFLSYDADPYPVLVNGEVKWIMDGFTTTSRYPYAQRADTRELPPGSGLDHNFNYVRNSVKVVVDAYDGTVTFYVIDPDDPMIQAYQKMFPALFTSEAPSPELASHFRYPEDLFRVQTNMWGKYRIGDPGEFYDATGRWAVAQDPGNSVGQVATITQTDEQGNVVSESEARISPQYLLMRLPGTTQESFLMFRPFVPFSENDERKNLTGFMVAHSDPARYGEIEVFELPPGIQVDGPSQFNSNLNTEPEISRQISLLEGDGSRVRAGNLLLIPVEESLVYVRPLFVEAEGTTGFPELKQVIVGVGDRVVMRTTLQEALEELIPGLNLDGLLGQDVTPIDATDGGTTDGGDGEPGTTPETPDSTQMTVEELLAAASQAFDEADQALRAGDLAGYQDAVRRAEGFIAQARDALGVAGDPTSTTTSTTASA